MVRTPFILCMLVALALASRSLGQSTAFTYQGQLKHGAQPAAGPHDMRFRMFDAAGGGNQVGATLCADNVAVAGGQFSVQLDFGQQFASPAPRFLEIQVRADIGQPCTDDFGYVTLTPRQAITAAPIASHAKTAFSLAAADGSPTNAVQVSNDGNVGIGTATPAVPLQIARDLDPVLVLQDTGPAATQSGYVGFWNSALSETGWMGFGTPGSPHLSVVNARSGGNIALLPGPSGNVGVGTASPAAKLDVRGDIRLGSNGQYRAAAGDENLRIIRGTVEWDGTVLRGQGFTAVRVNQGDYLITFTTPFSATPSVTATVDDRFESLTLIDFVVASVFSPNVNSVRVRTRQHSEAQGIPTGPSDDRFHFVAVGPR